MRNGLEELLEMRRKLYYLRDLLEDAVPDENYTDNHLAGMYLAFDLAAKVVEDRCEEIYPAEWAKADTDWGDEGYPEDIEKVYNKLAYEVVIDPEYYSCPEDY